MIVVIIFLCASFSITAMEKLSAAQVSKQQVDFFELVQREAAKSEDSVQVLNTINKILKSTKQHTFRDLKNIKDFEKHVLKVLFTIKALCESSHLAKFDCERDLLFKYVRSCLKKNAQKFILERMSEDAMPYLAKMHDAPSLQIFTCIILEKIKKKGAARPKAIMRISLPQVIRNGVVYTGSATFYFAAVLIAGAALATVAISQGVSPTVAIGCGILLARFLHLRLSRNEHAADKAAAERKLKLKKEIESKILQKAVDNRKARNKNGVLPVTQDQSTKTDLAPTISRLPQLSAEAGPEWCLIINGECLDTLITATIIEQIEQLAQRPIYELFDYVFASSMASLLALGLTASRDDEKPMVSTRQLIDLLVDVASQSDTPIIRQKKFYQKLHPLTYGAKLSNCLTKVFVPYIEQKVNPTGQSVRCYFDRSLAQTDVKQDVAIEDAIKDSVGDNSFIPARRYPQRNIQRRASSKYKNDAAAFLVEMNLYTDDSPKNLFIVMLSTGIVNDNNAATHDVIRKKLGLNFKTIKPAITPQAVTDCSPSVLASYKKAAEEAVKDSTDIIRFLVANYERKKSVVLEQ